MQELWTMISTPAQLGSDSEPDPGSCYMPVGRWSWCLCHGAAFCSLVLSLGLFIFTPDVSKSICTCSNTGERKGERKKGLHVLYIGHGLPSGCREGWEVTQVIPSQFSEVTMSVPT